MSAGAGALLLNSFAGPRLPRNCIKKTAGNFKLPAVLGNNP